MIEEHIEPLNDGVDHKAADDQSGSIGKNGVDGGRCPIAAVGCVKQPGLRDDHKGKGSQNADGDRFRCRFFSLSLAEDIRDQKGGSEQDVPQRLLHAESRNDDQDLDIGGDGGENGPAIKTLLAEVSEGKEHHGVSEENVDD